MCDLQPGTEYVSSVKAHVLTPVDVVVAGGGTAGVTAALAAARAGATTMLIEASGALGGMMTRGNAGLTMYMKFSGNPNEHTEALEALKENPRDLQIAVGLATEITNRLLQVEAALGTWGQAGKYVFTDNAAFKRLLLHMVAENDISLRLHTMAVDVIRDGTLLAGVVLESKSGRQIVPTKQVVDATGDGDLAVRAGAPYTLGVTADDLCAAQGNIGEMMAMGFAAGSRRLTSRPSQTAGWPHQD